MNLGGRERDAEFIKQKATSILCIELQRAEFKPDDKTTQSN